MYELYKCTLTNVMVRTLLKGSSEEMKYVKIHVFTSSLKLWYGPLKTEKIKINNETRLYRDSSYKKMH